ncbi:hypothetical protein MCEMIEM28_01541 [Burkholderiaceae bacterium]
MKVRFGKWSSYYALAVIELGEHIEALRQRPAKITSPKKSTRARPA